MFTHPDCVSSRVFRCRLCLPTRAKVVHVSQTEPHNPVSDTGSRKSKHQQEGTAEDEQHQECIRLHHAFPVLQ